MFDMASMQGNVAYLRGELEKKIISSYHAIYIGKKFEYENKVDDCLIVIKMVHSMYKEQERKARKEKLEKNKVGQLRKQIEEKIKFNYDVIKIIKKVENENNVKFYYPIAIKLASRHFNYRQFDYSRNSAMLIMELMSPEIVGRTFNNWNEYFETFLSVTLPQKVFGMNFWFFGADDNSGDWCEIIYYSDNFEVVSNNTVHIIKDYSISIAKSLLLYDLMTYRKIRWNQKHKKKLYFNLDFPKYTYDDYLEDKELCIKIDEFYKVCTLPPELKEMIIDYCAPKCTNDIITYKLLKKIMKTEITPAYIINVYTYTRTVIEETHEKNMFSMKYRCWKYPSRSSQKIHFDNFNNDF